MFHAARRSIKQRFNTERCFQVGEYVCRLFALTFFFPLMWLGVIFQAGTKLIPKDVSRIAMMNHIFISFYAV